MRCIKLIPFLLFSISVLADETAFFIRPIDDYGSTVAVKSYRWSNGLKAIKKLKPFKALIEAMRNANWYFAAQIERELTRFEICFPKSSKLTDPEKFDLLMKKSILSLLPDGSTESDRRALIMLLFQNQDKAMESAELEARLQQLHVRTTYGMKPVSEELEKQILFADDDRNPANERAKIARKLLGETSLPYSLRDFIERLDADLEKALLAKDIDLVRQLLASGASVNKRGTKTPMEFTPLLIAVLKSDFPEGALALVENNDTNINIASVSVQARRGTLYKECPHAKPEDFKKCLWEKRNEKLDSGEWYWALNMSVLMTAITEAQKHGNEESYLGIIRALLKRKDLKVNYQEDMFGSTALMNAIRSNNEIVLNLLLEDPRTNGCIENRAGETARELAVKSDASDSIVQSLKDREPVSGC